MIVYKAIVTNYLQAQDISRAIKIYLIRINYYPTIVAINPQISENCNNEHSNTYLHSQRKIYEQLKDST